MAEEASIRIAIEGMHCANCAANIEKHYRETPGVTDVAVNLAANTGIVRFDPSQTNVDALLHVFDSMSFTAQLIADDAPLLDVDRRAHEAAVRKHDLRVFACAAVLAVIIACICMIPGVHMALGMAIAGLLQGRSQALGVTVSFGESMLYANIVVLILTIPVQFGCGARFYKGAVDSLRGGSANMDVLVALGTSIAFLASLYITFEPLFVPGGAAAATAATLTNGGMPYFETCAMLIAFVLLGKVLETRAKGATGQAIEALINLAPPTAVVQRGGEQQEIPLAQVVVGDVVLVRPGDNIPVDGLVLEGETLVDQSMLTGEAEPVAAISGSAVTGGTRNVSAAIRVQATAVGAQSTLAKIVRAVQDAQGSKAPVQRLADKIAAVFVPAILGIAVLTFVLWMLLGPAGSGHTMRALLAAVAVVVVACPCALGLATPTALTVGMGKGAQLGILIRDGEVLEQLCKLNLAIFDKTGTLTQGVGRLESAAMDKVDVADFAHANDLRPEAPQALAKLQGEYGMQVYMVSGDTPQRAHEVAAALGIPQDHAFAQVDPLGKGDVVRKIVARASGDKPAVAAFVGDGINDAPAMAAATVGIALGSGTDVALEAGQVVLMRNNLCDIPEAIRLSRATMRKIKQNLFWALIYNVIMIPLAAFGILPPALAGAFMALSSVSVVSNSLLLKRFK